MNRPSTKPYSIMAEQLHHYHLSATIPDMKGSAYGSIVIGFLLLIDLCFSLNCIAISFSI